VSKPPAINSPKRAERSAFSARRNTGGKPAGEGPVEGWIWGRHAVIAALESPRRQALELRVTKNALREIPESVDPQIVQESAPRHLDSTLPDGAVHQGFALRARALEPEPLQAVADPTHGVLIVLDQVTDPHNVGAVMRSAAGFGARAVILQDRKAPPLFGTVCKSAVGAAERIGHVRVVNIADALIALREAGRRVIGLDGTAETDLAAALAEDGGPGRAGPGAVLVLGSEDKGLRPRVAESCDLLARIPISAGVESLNVSNAAAIALYEATKNRPAR